MSQGSMSQRAALVAVIIAFAVGIVGSLAVRPPGARAPSTPDARNPTENRIHWRLPIAFASNLPALGDNVVYVTETLDAASAGAIVLDIYEPNEIVRRYAIGNPSRKKLSGMALLWGN